MTFSTYYISNESKNVQKTYVMIETLVLKIRHLVVDIVENDVTCDTKYMLSTMDRVENILREKVHWASMDDDIYLIMNNNGGHDKNDAIKKYTFYLKTKYNIKIIHQVSPYCNAIDIGVGCSL